MKKHLTFLALFISVGTYAQYCGNSGPQVCTPEYYVADTNKWFYPPFDSIPCVARNLPYSHSVNIRCDSLPASFGGQTIVFKISFRVDSIAGLPDGICWATNLPSNHTNGGWMCISFSGLTAHPTGDYPCNMYGTAIPVNIVTIYNEPYKVSFTLRVREATEECASIANSMAVGHQPSAKLITTENGVKITGTSSVTQILVFNAMGQTLIQQTIPAGATTDIPLTGLRGLLLISIADTDGTKTHKLIWQ